MRKSLWNNLLTVSGLSDSGHNNWQAFLGDISIICLSKWLVIFLTKLMSITRQKEAYLEPSLHGGNLPQVTLTSIGCGQESQSKNKASQQNIGGSKVDVARCSIDFIYLYHCYFQKGVSEQV